MNIFKCIFFKKMNNIFKNIINGCKRGIDAL